MQRNVVQGNFNIKKADWELFKSETKNIINHLPNVSLENIEQALEVAAAASIPRYRAGRDKQKFSNIWWTDEIKSLCGERKKARKLWKKKRTSLYRMKYNRAAAKCKRAIRAAKTASWRKFVGSLNSNTPCSAVWKKFKAIQGKTEDKIFHLENPDGSIVSGDFEVAQALNSMYSDRSGNEEFWPNHFLPNKDSFIAQLMKGCKQHDMADKPFVMNELTEAIDQLKNSAPGEDGIHNAMLQNASNELLHAILEYFNKIWEYGEIPSKWKVSTIIPLLKTGKNPTKANSYRPVALTSALGKLLERVVNNRLTWRLEHYQLLSKHQFGFRPRRSTTDALLTFTDKIYEGFSKMHSTVAVFIDFEAAFDRIPYVSILSKCLSIGLKGKLLNYISNFLHDRKIKTKVGQTFSDETESMNGIPQGAVLSPSVFNIALYDLEGLFSESIGITVFADDVTLWSTHKDPLEAVKELQAALDNFSQWALKWGMVVSTSKSEVSFFTRRYTLSEFVPHLIFNGALLPFNNHPKLLGVILDPKLLWKHHIDFILEQTVTRINALKAVAGRSWGADTLTLRQFYLSFIRAKMTYCCEIWGSAASNHILKIHRIQNAALRICLGCTKTTSVDAMEIEMGIESIQMFLKSRKWEKYLSILALPPIHPLHNLTTQNLVRHSFYFSIATIPATLKEHRPEKIPIVRKSPPWLSKVPNITCSVNNLTKADSPPLLLKSETLKLIDDKYNGYIKIYTDGSVDLQKGRAGAGYYCPDLEERFFIPCNPTSSVDTELLAINAALMKCISMKEERKICIITDSKAALQIISNLSPDDYSFRKMEIHDILDRLVGKDIRFQWVPSHCDIAGNEEADKTAKLACRLQPTPSIKKSLSNCKLILKSTVRNEWIEKWEACNTGRSLFDIQKTPGDPGVYRNVPRSVAVFAARARTGHIVTEQYLFRFNIADDPRCRLCKRTDETIFHILIDCPFPIEGKNALISCLGADKNIRKILNNKELWPMAEKVYRGHRAIGSE